MKCWNYYIFHNNTSLNVMMLWETCIHNYCTTPCRQHKYMIKYVPVGLSHSLVGKKQSYFDWAISRQTYPHISGNWDVGVHRLTRYSTFLFQLNIMTFKNCDVTSFEKCMANLINYLCFCYLLCKYFIDIDSCIWNSIYMVINKVLLYFTKTSDTFR